MSLVSGLSIVLTFPRKELQRRQANKVACPVSAMRLEQSTPLFQGRIHRSDDAGRPPAPPMEAEASAQPPQQAALRQRLEHLVGPLGVEQLIVGQPLLDVV